MKKNLFKKYLVVPMVLSLVPALTLAVDDPGIGNISKEAPVVNLETVLTNVRNLFFGAVIVTCVFMILWAAFNYATSAGDQEKVKTAQRTITYAVIGLIVAALANTIVAIVSGVVMNK